MNSTSDHSAHPDDAHLFDFVDGNLAPDDRTRVEGHLATCAQCRTAVEAVTSWPTRGVAQTVDSLPPAAADRMHAALAQEWHRRPRGTVARKPRPRWIPQWNVGVALGTAVLLLGVVTVVGSLPDQDARKDSGSALPSRTDSKSKVGEDDLDENVRGGEAASAPAPATSTTAAGVQDSASRPRAESGAAKDSVAISATDAPARTCGIGTRPQATDPTVVVAFPVAAFSASWFICHAVG